MYPDGRPAATGLGETEARRPAPREKEGRRSGAKEGSRAIPQVRGGGRLTCAVDAGERLSPHGLRRPQREGRVSRREGRASSGPRGEARGPGRGAVGGGQDQTPRYQQARNARRWRRGPQSVPSRKGGWNVRWGREE